MFVKFAFAEFNRKVFFSEFSEHFLNMLDMFFIGLREYEDVVKVGEGEIV